MSSKYLFLALSAQLSLSLSLPPPPQVTLGREHHEGIAPTIAAFPTFSTFNGGNCLRTALDSGSSHAWRLAGQMSVSFSSGP